MFDKIGDWLEKQCSRPIAIPIFLVALVFSRLLFGVDITNLAISIFTVILLFLGMGKSRRNWLALQVKLDDLEKSVPSARTSNIRIEDLPEEEIENLRN